MVRAVVFGVDGTLADTADLALRGGQVPYDVLSPSGTSDDRQRWGIQTDHIRRSSRLDASDFPGELITRGYLVGIVSNAPVAYSSTLCHLLGVDAEFLYTTGGRSDQKSKVLRRVMEGLGLEISDLLYVGSEPGDSMLFREGINCVGAEAIRNGWLLTELRPVSRVLPVNLTYNYESVPTLRVLSELRQSLNLGVPDEARHGVVRSLVDADPSMTPEARLALDIATLMAAPSVTNRRELQSRVLSSLQPVHLSCVVRRSHGLLRLDPRIVSLHELRGDEQLRNEYLAGLARMFVRIPSQMRVGDRDVPVSAVRIYDRSPFGKILGDAKQYGADQAYVRGGRWRSGRMVQLGLTDLVADSMSAMLDTSSSVPLVPVPPSAFSPEQPGELSYRLTASISRMTGRPILRALERADDIYRVADGVMPRRVVVVEDQTTSGETVRECVQVLLDAGFDVAGVLVYSISNRLLAGRENAAGEEDKCPLAEVMRWLDRECLCEESW